MDGRKQPSSLRSRLLTAVLLCWVLPVLCVTLLAGWLIGLGYERSARQELDARAENALEQLEMRLDAVFEASKTVSYDGVVRNSYRLYQRDGDGAALYRAVTDYLNQSFTRDERILAVFISFWEDIDVSPYASSRGDFGYSVQREYHETIEEDLLARVRDLDTRILPLEYGGELYVARNNGTVENHLELPQSADDAVAQKWATGLNDIKALYEAGYFPANTLTASDAETVELFNAGEAAFLIDGSWKVGYFTANAADLNDFAIAFVPGKGERSASEAIGGISMGYFITRKAWDDPAKREAAVEFVSQLTSDEVLSTFVTTEVTALVNGASPAGLNALQQSAADANASITAIAGAVQDNLTAEARGDLFANVQNVVTGKMSAEDAIASAIALN